MVERRLSDAQILSQIPAARARAAKERKSGLQAVSARYDRPSRRFVLELAKGYLFAFPVAALPHLARATPRELAEVEVTSGGTSIRFDALDADYSVPALIMSSMAPREATRELARLAGRATSMAKARASRANGVRGGRPRKT